MAIFRRYGISSTGSTSAKSRPGARGEGRTFASIDDVLIALEMGEVETLTPIKLRYTGKVIDLVTNDGQRSAVEIAALYKERWQIELLFRWIKQHLNIRRFIGSSENAIRLQILVAMITFLLLRLALVQVRPSAPRAGARS